MKQREKDLLTILINEKDQYITSHSLASKLELSDRTIRNYVKGLKDILLKNGAEIVSKQGYGYKLKVFDRVSFDLFLADSHVLHKESFPSVAGDVEDRKKYILNLLILEEKELNVSDLADELYISDSQINKDLSDIKKLLATYDLSLDKKKQLIRIEGKEKAKRHFIMNYFFSDDYLQLLKSSGYIEDMYGDIGIDMLTIIILDECREAKLKVSDFIIQNLVLHLALSIKRVDAGFNIKSLGMDQEFEQSVEYDVSKKILKRVEEVTGIEFPKEEREYLTLHLMAKSTHENTKKQTVVSQELQGILLKMQEDTGYPFASDRQLFNGLLEHITPMLIRLEKNIQQNNPLLDDIKADYMEYFEFTKYYLADSELFKRYNVSDSEWAYITLHILAAIEKYKENQKIKVMIICATGFGSAQLLKNRVEKVFGNYVTIVSVKGYYEIDEESLCDVDCIISSIDLSMIVLKIPVFHVSVFLSDSDISELRAFFSSKQPSLKSKNQLTLSELIETNKEDRWMDELMSDYFISYQDSVSREKVLSDLLSLMQINEEDNYVDKMMYQMTKREDLGGVVFSESIAVPHPIQPVGSIAKIGVAIIPNGMYWNEEFQDIKFVFLISQSKFVNDGMKSITKRIVELIDCLSIQEDMLKVKSFNEFKNLFEKVEI